jgi:hypothetical protein
VGDGLDSTFLDAAEAQPVDAAQAADVQRRHRLAFVVTGLVVLFVLVMLPVAIASMVQTLGEQESEIGFNLLTSDAVDASAPIAPDAVFVNLLVKKIDESEGLVTLIASGHQACPSVCPQVNATFYALGSDSAVRHGVPPSAAVTVPPKSGSYSFTLTLPIQGTPQRYPFDTYTLVLGISGSLTLPNGMVIPIDPQGVFQHGVTVTVDNHVTRLEMDPPRPVNPAAVRSPSDPVQYLLVDTLVWSRPLYLRILTVLLVLLISASSVLALSMRTLSELLLSIGGIILGIWGVRAIVVQTTLPEVTIVDLMLAFVILLMLLTLSVRAARHFYGLSGFRLPGLRANTDDPAIR